jgi:hypothetical protein
VKIKETGFPDFTDWLIRPWGKFPDGANFSEWPKFWHGFLPQVFFPLRGKRQNSGGDYQWANHLTLRFFKRDKYGGPGKGPLRGNYNHDWTWHHHEVVGIMQLVPYLVHRASEVVHVGGVLYWEVAYNKDYAN